MKKSFKKNTGIYTFLDASGLLEHGTGNQIEDAKKEYWKDYKKKWKKEKQKTHKLIEIYFDLNELKVIAKGAKKYHTNPTSYIKQSALAEKQDIIDKIVIAEIRELVILHHTTLLNLAEENELSKSISTQLLNQTSQLEKRILDFFSSFK